MFGFLDMSKKLGPNDFLIFDSLVHGDQKLFLTPWYPDVEEIYFPLNVNKHWVVVQASLVQYKLTVYDSDIGVNTDEAMKTVLEPI